MSKKQKPDLLVVLAVIVALGVIGTSVAQGMFSQSPNQIAQSAVFNSLTR